MSDLVTNINKKTPEGVCAGCAGVCNDYFERSWTVVEYMGWCGMYMDVLF